MTQEAKNRPNFRADTMLLQTRTALQSRNVRIHGRRTSVRLEQEMWSALNEISALEHCTVHEICGAVNDRKGEGMSFTAALRVFLMEYYRNVGKSQTESGNILRQFKGVSNTPPQAANQSLEEEGAFTQPALCREISGGG